MLLQNLHHSLTQNSNIFWEGRFVFDGPEQTQKLWPRIEQNEKEDTPNINELLNSSLYSQQNATEYFSKAFKNVDQDVQKKPEITDQIQKPFETIKAKIWTQELIIKLTEELKSEMSTTQENSSQKEKTAETTKQAETLTVETLKNILHSFDLSITVKWVGDIQIPEATEHKLLTAVLEGKKDFKITDSEYLKKQFEKPNSAESKILLIGYEQILKNIQDTPEQRQKEKDVFKNIIIWFKEIPSPTNENLLNILANRFNIEWSPGTNTLKLIDITQPENKISDFDEIWKSIKNYAEWIGIKIENNQNNNGKKELYKKIDDLAWTQSKSIENIKTQIKEMQEATEENEGSFFNQIRDLIVLFREFFSGDFNVDKIDGMWKRLKLKDETSDTNEFEMTYKEGEKVAEKNVKAIMKNKEVTVTKDNKKETITITDPDKQLQDIKIEDGKVTFAVIPLVVTEWQTNTNETTELVKDQLTINTIGEEAWKQLLNKINNKETLTIGNLNNKTPLKIKNSDLNLTEFESLQDEKWPLIKIKTNEGSLVIRLSKDNNWDLKIHKAWKLIHTLDVKYNSETNTIELSKKKETT